MLQGSLLVKIKNKKQRSCPTLTVLTRWRGRDGRGMVLNVLSFWTYFLNLCPYIFIHLQKTVCPYVHGEIFVLKTRTKTGSHHVEVFSHEAFLLSFSSFFLILYSILRISSKSLSRPSTVQLKQRKQDTTFTFTCSRRGGGRVWVLQRQPSPDLTFIASESPAFINITTPFIHHVVSELQNVQEIHRNNSWKIVVFCVCITDQPLLFSKTAVLFVRKCH